MAEGFATVAAAALTGGATAWLAMTAAGPATHAQRVGCRPAGLQAGDSPSHGPQAGGHPSHGLSVADLPSRHPCQQQQQRRRRRQRRRPPAQPLAPRCCHWPPAAHALLPLRPRAAGAVRFPPARLCHLLPPAVQAQEPQEQLRIPRRHQTGALAPACAAEVPAPPLGHPPAPGLCILLLPVSRAWALGMARQRLGVDGGWQPASGQTSLVPLRWHAVPAHRQQQPRSRVENASTRAPAARPEERSRP